MVVYLQEGELLVPGITDGEIYRSFGSLEIPVGIGLSGWVVENGKAIVNGNPAVEPGYITDSTQGALLRSALAVPVETQDGIRGVVSLYRQERDAFGVEQLILLVSSAAALGRALDLTSDRATAGLRIA